MSPLWEIVKPMRWRLLGAGLLGATTEASGIALMATATWLLVTAAGQPPLHALTIAIVTVRAMAIAKGTFRYAERLASHDAVLRMVTEVRARIFASLIDRPLARRGDALNRMVSDVDAVQDLVIRVALPIAASGLVAVASVVFAAMVDPVAALALAGGLVIAGVLLPMLAARLAGRASATLAPLRATFAVATIDLVHGAADLAAFGARPAYAARAQTHAAELAAVEKRLARRAALVDGLATVVTGLTATLVLMVALARDVSGVWAAVLAVATLATGELTLSLLGAVRKRAEIQGSLNRVVSMLDGRPANPPQPDGAGVDGRSMPTADPRLTGPTRLDGVRVDGRLGPIDLVIPDGQKVAIVGPSGAGKSTLVQVLAGLIAPDSGTVTVSGSATGLLADAHVFHATVRDNLLIAQPSAADEELERALAVSGLAAYPLNVVVGEDGAELSGGQRQRLALARAVLARPQILLLDEPTEGLDPIQADEVLAAVLDDYADRTVVVVTHRLSALDRFDAVLVLDAGEIIERDASGWVRAHA